MTLAAPWFLILLPAVVLFAAPFGLKLPFMRAKEAEKSLAFLSPVSFVDLRFLAHRSSWRVRAGEKTLAILRIVAWILLVIALARPQRVQQFDESDMSGRDIMLTLDISGSMQALDFELEGQPRDRLTVLKFMTRDFIDERKGDRMGLVVFGDKVFVQCPLTTDGEAVNRFVEALEIGMAGSGTAIGDALAVSLKRIKNIPENSKVILLVTDGKSNAGSVQPVEAAELAKKMGVKVHVLGIGANGTAPFPTKDMFGITRLVPRTVDYDEPTLSAIAKTTGGKYFNARNSDQLQEIYSEIDSLEKRVTKGFQTSRVEELFPVPLIAGAFALLIAELLALTTLRRAII